MTRLVSKFVLYIGIAVLVLACFLRFAPMFFTSENASVLTSSVLTDAIDMAELSTAEFKYRGIADIYADENRTQIRCRVCYSAVVKAGIDMKDVSFDIPDQEKKVVLASLPDIDIKVTIIDEQSMALLPSDADVGIDVMLKYSREDAENEAKQSGELLTAARDNLKKTIEGLLFPLLEPQGYALVWN